MKSNNFRHLRDNGYSKEVSVLCFVNFFALVLFRCWKRTLSKILVPEVSIISRDNKSEVLAKKTWAGCEAFSLVQVDITQPAITSSKLTIKTLEQGMKCVKS